jgi:uncharacterized protein (TIRG00374 family)
MSLRFWVNIVTFILLAFVVVFSWDSVVQAFGLIGRVNIWIYLLMIPIQLISYYSISQIMFSYLKKKGDIVHLSFFKKVRIALELNFVNHIVPVPSIAGFSYFNWVMKRLKVSSSRSSMAYMLRFATSFLSFALLIIISVAALMFDSRADKRLIIASAFIVVVTIIGVGLITFAIDNKKRLIKISSRLSKFVNKIVSIITIGKRQHILKINKVETFLIDFHEDYVCIMKDKSLLLRPFLWAVVNCSLDVLLILIAFISIGSFVNPAVLMITYGFCALAGTFVPTPGGAGAIEAIMISLFISTGISADTAIAGTLLARVGLFAGTIIFGYIFYQLTINKYGKIPKSTNV